MRIKNEYVDLTVKEILPKIFAVFVKDRYQRSMLFCRYQEFYESPYNEIRNKFFTWEKFMMVYKNKKRETLFTYPTDWSGYNIPSKIIFKGLIVFDRDKGPYDEIMNTIWYYCENYPLKFDKPRTKWYLIGTDINDVQTMNHEIAHGLYYTNRKYKNTCDDFISKMKKRDYNFFKKILISMGYVDDDKIIKDEIQAYLSTGLYGNLNKKEFKKYENNFIKNFKTYRHE